MPNIAIAMLLVHKATADPKYILSAAKALRYSVTQQMVPGHSGLGFDDDPNTHWGFWSWDPPYDHTMSADQSTHHARGYWFFVDYMASLSPEEQARIEKAIVSTGNRLLPRSTACHANRSTAEP